MAISTNVNKTLKLKAIKDQIKKEISFLGGIFSSLTLPVRMRDDGDDLLEEDNDACDQTKNQEVNPKRAKSIAELEERLEKLKSQNNRDLKQKLLKKSLSSKLSKKIKKQHRNSSNIIKTEKEKKPDIEKLVKPSPHVAKPIFNHDGKLVFSKFDFANTGHKDKVQKTEKDPKKILENLTKQEEKLKELEEHDNIDKAKEIRQKTSWKNVLQKAEGQKVKDDKILLKKSIKKMEQKKKKSKKDWDSRIEGVQRKKEERQKKRQDNIVKKKKEKKTKVIKASAKRGRVVI